MAFNNDIHNRRQAIKLMTTICRYRTRGMPIHDMGSSSEENLVKSWLYWLESNDLITIFISDSEQYAQATETGLEFGALMNDIDLYNLL